MFKSEKGAGLVEIIVAILIFGVGISAALRILPSSNRAATRAGNLTVATNLAQEKVEELMSFPHSSTDLSSGVHTDPDNPLDIHYTRNWTVVNDSPVPDMKTLTVSVSYQTSSKDSVVTMSTYLTSRR
ncbi:MAG: type II secretion system protein [Candidatus Krumholzibacteriota bacterium]|nr:type II secretion system protein [Candidatus Krumholzibacteriota bacterium]